MTTNPRDLALALSLARALKDASTAAFDRLRAQMLDALGDAGSDSTSAFLDGEPIGKSSLTRPKPQPRVTDPDAFLAWVETTAPDEVVVTRTVRPTYVDALLATCTLVDGDAITPDGEPVPGVTVVQQAPFVTHRVTMEQRERVIAAWMNGTLPEPVVMAVTGDAVLVAIEASS